MNTKDEHDQQLVKMAQNAIVLASALEAAGGSAKMVMRDDCSLNEFLISLARNNIVLNATYVSP